jgi:opacity protein-like surface antigen
MINKFVIGLASACAMGLSVNAMAGDADIDNSVQNTTTGFYILGQAGYGWDDGFSSNQSQNIDDGVKLNKGKNGFTGRAGIGYQFNPYLGLQAGFAYLPAYKYEATYTGNGGTQSTAGIKLSFYAIDAMGVVTLPINDSLYVYGGAGAAYVHMSKDVTAESGNLSSNINLGKEGYIRPKLAAGVGYKINPNVALTVEYAHIFQKDTNDSHIGVPSFDTVMAGVQYTF